MSKMRCFTMVSCLIMLLLFTLAECGTTSTGTGSYNLGTIYLAKKIITMNPAIVKGYPNAVAVLNSMIVGVGDLDALALQFHDFTIDRRFKNKVLMPGLIEAHMHTMDAGTFWQWIFVGQYARTGPDGAVHSPCPTKEDVIQRLIAEAPSGTGTIAGWSFDPSLLPDYTVSFTRVDLDRVSTTRCVIVINASEHIFYVNSYTLRKANITSATTTPGVEKDDTGQPTGVLKEPPAMQLVAKELPATDYLKAANQSALMAQKRGCTTISDLAFPLSFFGISVFKEAVQKSLFPVRVVITPFYPTIFLEPKDLRLGVAIYNSMKALGTDQVRVSHVKFVLDGSIQGFTANLQEIPNPSPPPAALYYWNGYPNGMINISFGNLLPMLQILHDAGIPACLHTNGDGATEEALEALESVQTENPRSDIRHRIEHCQAFDVDADESMFQRAARLGARMNIFSNHLYYWGDFHYSTTLGPERAAKMNNAAHALKLGIPLSLHSDCPVSPVDPLFSVWCAAARTTISGRVLGPQYRISVMDGLWAMTMGSAYLMDMEKEIGSIEVGKKADITILEEDPLTAPLEDLKNFPVWGTMLGGRIYPAGQSLPVN